MDNVMGNVTGSGNYLYLDTTTLTAIPNYGYHFVQWNDGITDNPRTVTIERDSSFDAQFAVNGYSITVMSSDTTAGMVMGSGNYNYLDTMTMSATVIAPHYEFVGWSDGVMDNPRSITVTRDSSFTAMFALVNYTINARSNDPDAGTVTGSGVYTYPQQVTLEATANEGYFFGGWNDGNVDNPRTITVDASREFVAWFYEKPTLCMVSVENDRNVVSWAKSDTVTQYRIYREGTTSGQYDLVATLSYDQNSSWVDTLSSARTRSYRYTISGVSSLGIESEKSEAHKTMHLTISRGVGNDWNLMWTAYEGAEYSTYIIYRGTNAGNLTLVEEIPSNGNTSFTDNTSSYPVYYQVGIVLDDPCDMAKNDNVILSNIAFDDATGIRELMNNPYIISTNRNSIIVKGEKPASVRVLDNLGRIIVSGRHHEGESHFDVPSSGVYMIQIGGYPAQKVVVVR